MNNYKFYTKEIQKEVYWLVNCMLWLKNKKNNFPVHTLIWGPECGPISLIQSPQDQSFYFQLSA